jgi:uncharacterized protein (DUF2235 family)
MDAERNKRTGREAAYLLAVTEGRPAGTGPSPLARASPEGQNPSDAPDKNQIQGARNTRSISQGETGMPQSNPPPAFAGKNLVVLSDGTGNSSAKAEKTNVWRMFQALDQAGTRQLAKYDDGVGTSSNKYLAMAGGAFGWGLKRNVLDLYKFLCRNYKDGDRIYGFGFSRGAFTIRVLTGLVSREGLVTFRTEAELDRHAAEAYRSYRRKSFHRRSPIVWISRGLRDLFIGIRNGIQRRQKYMQIHSDTRHPRVHFLGLWDTVEAYGVPVNELKRAIDLFIWPLLFGDCKLPEIVNHACHALSLDDERKTFHPLLWDELDEAQRVAAARASPKIGDTSGMPRDSRITQVWFAGVHSNVGGGYPEDQLSLVTLRWMMAQASAHQLLLEPNAVRRVEAEQSPYARIYDSRHGFAAYYRYAPRRVEVLERKDHSKIWPIIHGSVVMRMAHGSDGYAPITIPHQFWVLDPAGHLVPMAGRDGMQLDDAKALPESGSASDPELGAAIARLAKPERAAIKLVWDTVFWRRCVYFLTMALTLWLVLFPWTWHFEVSDADRATSGPVSVLVEAISNLLPAYAQSWKQALISYPLEFGSLVASILFCLAGSAVLEQRIHDRSRLAWHVTVASTYDAWREHIREAWSRWLAVSVTVLTALSIAAFIFANRETRQTIGVATGLSWLVALLRYVGYKQMDGAESRTPIRSTLALSIARFIRGNRLLRRIYAALANNVVPFAVVIVLVVGAFFLINRAAFDIEDSAGFYCKSSAEPRIRLASVGQTQGDLQAPNDKLCWASGVELVEGERYLITLSTGGDWFDQTVRTDPTGFDADSWIHYSAAPLKRRWRERWLQPIARIGALGNQEYPLEPIDDVAAWPPSSCGMGAQYRDRSKPVREKIAPALAEKLLKCNPTPKDRLVMRSLITAQSTGELFLYVNDAVWGMRPWADTFVANNSGTTKLTIKRLPKSPSADEVDALSE